MSAELRQGYLRRAGLTREVVLTTALPHCVLAGRRSPSRSPSGGMANAQVLPTDYSGGSGRMPLFPSIYGVLASRVRAFE